MDTGRLIKLFTSSRDCLRGNIQEADRMRTVANPYAASVMAVMLSYKGDKLYNSNVGQLHDRLLANISSSIITCVLYVLVTVWVTTLGVFLSNRINSPNRPSEDPYHGIPKEEVKGTCKIELDQMQPCGIAVSDVFSNLKISDAGGKMICMTDAVSTVTPARPLESTQESKIHKRGIRHTL